jgi:hypothetical protein
VANSTRITKLNFSENIGRKYARVSGDYNPIHLWPLTSRLFGFKRAIAHGMYSHALALSALQHSHQIDLRTNVSIKALFKQPIVLPVDVECTVKACKDNSLDFSLFSEKPSAHHRFNPHLIGCITPLEK